MHAAHIARHGKVPEASMTKARPDGRTLTIDWADGHRSTFHTVWLWDNCSCEACGDHSGGHRFFELNELPEDLSLTAEMAGDLLRLTWQADGHVTHFDPAWLRAHCYSDTERRKRRKGPARWGSSMTGKLPEVDYESARQDPAELLRLLDAVRRFGICLLRNVPAKSEATEEIAGLIGHIRETHCGRIFEIHSTPEPAVIANAPVPLRPHTDKNFREPPPGIMIFHSIRASRDGGGASVMTDGFKLAEDLRTLDPEAIHLLTRVPIPHRRFIDGVGLRAEAPVIQLDHFSEIREFRLNERTMGPIDLPGELIEPVYAALATMFKMTYDPKYHVHHLLMDGEALVFDNARVLHARTGFNGNRHVRLTHVCSDEVYSRWRQLKSRLEGAINPIS